MILTVLRLEFQDQGVSNIDFKLWPLSLAYRQGPSLCVLTFSFLCVHPSLMSHSSYQETNYNG